MAESLLDRVLPVWRRTISLSWPIAIQQSLNTLMRTVDIIVTGLFSPAAVAAIGLADLYSDIPRQIGSSLGAGAIALASQDTGRDAAATRDRAITQAILLAFVVGLPFIAIGWIFSDILIEILGAAPDVVRLGGAYLMIVFAVGPLRIVGVGLATAISRTIEAVAMLLAIASARTPPSFARPRSLTITRQIVSIGLPRFAEQMSRSVASFPFNALLLLFGTEVNAAYHIARRIYQQFIGPIYRSFSTVTSIVIGQELGEGNAAGARFAGLAIVLLSVSLMTVGGALLFALATPLVHVFSNDPRTIDFAIDFTRVFAVSMVLFGVMFPFIGGLRGAGDTRTPFYAQFVGRFGFLLGFSYLTAIVLGYGLLGIYAGIVLMYVSRGLIVSVVFLWGNWAETAATMMADRADAMN